MGFVAQTHQRLVLPPMTPAQFFLDRFDQGGFTIELNTHELAQPCGLKRQLDRIAMGGSEPAVRNRRIAGVDEFVAERMPYADQPPCR